MKIFKLIYLASQNIIIELLGIITIIIFKPLALINKNSKYQYFLIDIINIFYFPLTFQLRKIRNNQKDIKTFRKNYGSGIGLYNNIIGNNWQHDKKILDIGCGSGKLIYELVKNGAKYGLGTDLSKRNINIANNCNNIANLEYDTIYTNKIVKKNKKFDYVISHTAFEHIEKNSLLGILNDIAQLLENNGKAIITYNHYNDKYGSHLKAFIFHPWPQVIFNESFIFSYWTNKLHIQQKKGKMMYFPVGYNHGIGKGNNDCFMNLNKLNISDFEKIIENSNLILEKKVLYSKTILLRILPFLGKIKKIKSYLEGSCSYILIKKVNENK